MPKLQSLKIEFCPHFEVLPHRLLLKASSLEYLEVSSCDDQYWGIYGATAEVTALQPFLDKDLCEEASLLS
ncbi:hypothetical protein LIER_10119 [Lithospermum erythrorhizon]|uniref:Uncharacterized protein n=1 Tax=Lithospermum erythrorhizon TaxID=34254 RepID=A0AAV3PJF8_LITER